MQCGQGHWLGLGPPGMQQAAECRGACQGLTCMVKVQTTISPRRKRRALLDSARSDALEEARGYSPAPHDRSEHPHYFRASVVRRKIQMRTRTWWSGTHM